MRSILFIIAFIIVLVVLRLTLFSENTPATPGKPQGGAPMPVSAVVTSRVDFNPSMKAAGSILAWEEVQLMPEIAGKVVFLNINEGGKVNKGDLLLRLNSAEWQAQLHKAEASVKLFRSNLNRQDELLKVQGISQQQRDETEQQLSMAEADAEYFRAMLSKCELRAPFSGVLGLRMISEGAIVNPSTLIASLFKTDKLRLDFSVPERYASSLSAPLEVSFQIQGDQGAYKARVFAIEPSASSENRSIRLRAEVDNSAGHLLPGRFADVNIPLTRDSSVILLPTQCIVPILKGKQVWVSNMGKAEAVKVETGYRTDELVEIRSGLQMGDTVLTSGIMSVRPGAALKIKVEKFNSNQAAL
jgi:membrane fusion protein (multidrug efflux system)